MAHALSLPPPGNLTLPTCETCREILSQNPDTSGDALPPRLFTIEDVKNWPGLHHERIQGTHAATVKGVLARYRLPSKIQCAYSGHRHRNGFIVRLLCGFVSNFGPVCTSHTIVNFEEIEDELMRLDTLDRNKRWLSNIETFAATVRRYIAAVDALAGAADRLVTSDAFAALGQFARDEGYLQLQGRSIFKAPKTWAVRARLDELVAAVSRHAPGFADVFSNDVAEWALEGRRIESAEKALVRWYEGARLLFKKRNLEHLVAVACEAKVVRAGQIRVEGDALVAGGRMLSEDGLRNI